MSNGDTCMEHSDYVAKLLNANKGGKYNGWEVPYDWLLYQVHRDISEGNKGVFIAVKLRGKDEFIDPENYELCFRGFNPGGDITCFEDFPPIRWP